MDAVDVEYEPDAGELSLAQAHLLTGISLYLLRAAIAGGQLDARNCGHSVNRWRISRESLEAFEALSVGYSIAQAQRLYGISRQALRAAIADGRLEARNARQRHDAPGHDGDRWVISREALESFIASCPVCAWPGCERPGVTPAGRCSRSHAGPLDRRKSAETRAKLSAAKMGQRKGVPLPHTPEWDEHIRDGIRRFWQDADRSQARRQAKSEELRRSWETGEGAAAGYIATKSGRTRSRLFGRWAAQKAGRVGGRERGYTDLQAKGVLELRQENPTLGRQRLAERSGLTEKQVRAILGEAADVPSAPGG